MDNVIVIDPPKNQDNTITYSFRVEGPWAEVFRLGESFSIDYSCDISAVPDGISIIPLLANLLPVAWVYNAEIVVPTCDRDFYESIPAFQKGYREMYPMMEFKGKLTVEHLQNNQLPDAKRSGAFFSGGVDAYHTLITHAEEKPVLITLWGSDVWLWDTAGWKNVKTHLKQTADDFGVESVTVQTRFRYFLSEDKLCEKVAATGDNWWHAFQHGIGIISHAAPVAYALGLSRVYIASSFTAADKGKVACASDPTIDNFVRFCSAQVVHDGYEYTRQMKVHRITQYVQKTGRKIALRVCWESSGGANCCNCEKCWRTILSIYAEGFDPKNYGFDYDDFGKLCKKIHANAALLKCRRDSYYGPAQIALRKNYTPSRVCKELRWFYRANINRLGDPSPWGQAILKARHFLRKTQE